MDKLNPEQQEAVNTIDGPVLVLAGAGSGKTKVLTYRIAHLLEKKVANFENILAVTFTNKAANEMKKRVAEILNDQSITSPQSPLFWMGTFHSICLKILKHNAIIAGLEPNFLIYDTDDQLDAVRGVLKKLNFTDKIFVPKGILSQISNAKNKLLTPEMYERITQGFFFDNIIKIYKEYQKVLRSNNAVDFDDLIMKTVQLFEGSPDILRKYQELFKYILIDEYQDTNHAQYKFTNLLAQKHQNICVVGDDAQSIYSFRGADIQNILSFERDYPNAKIVKLEQNYRSTKKILSASNKIIALNRNQKPKTMWTENKEGGDIIVYEAMNEKDEAHWIGKKIQNLQEKGISQNDIVILYRTHAQSRSLEEGFIRLGINYIIIGGVKFYSRKEIKDILAYLKLIYNQKDSVSFQRVVNTPTRGIGEKKLERVIYASKASKQTVLEYLLSNKDNEEIDQGLRSFAKLIEGLIETNNNNKLTVLIEEIFNKSGYYKMLTDKTDKVTENEARIENIKELLSVATKYDALEPHLALETFLNEVALIEEQSRQNNAASEKVTMMTIHTAKGLEYDHVFVTGLEEMIFPHARASEEPAEMEEERRLAYVAYTRAKQQLYLTFAESRTYFGSKRVSPVSRFVTDIPEDLLFFENYNGGNEGWELVTETPDTSSENSMKPGSPKTQVKKGDYVKHFKYGVGKIIECDDTTAIIEFANGRLVPFELQYTPLEKLAG